MAKLSNEISSLNGDFSFCMAGIAMSEYILQAVLNTLIECKQSPPSSLR